MVDEKKFIIKLQELLVGYGYEQHAGLLYGASCEFKPTYFPPDDPDGAGFVDYWTLYLKLSVQSFVILEEDSDIQAILLHFAKKAVPKNEIHELRDMTLTLNYEDDTDNSDFIPAKSVVPFFNPLFGNPSTDDKYQCNVFVIMPFKPELKPVYDDIIKPVVENMGYTIKRADDLYTDKESMDKIWSMFHACQLVIADCTGHNPNVFYELGIAHTLGKPTIVITQGIDSLPFDIRNKDALEPV